MQGSHGGGGGRTVSIAYAMASQRCRDILHKSPMTGNMKDIAVQPMFERAIFIRWDRRKVSEMLRTFRLKVYRGRIPLYGGPPVA